MAYTYSKLATYTVGSGGVPSVTFLNIPQNYTDLVVKGSARSTQAFTSSELYVQFNGTTTEYSDKYVFGTGSAAASGTGLSTKISTGIISAASNTADTFGSLDFYIPNYTGSAYKSVSTDVVQETNATASHAWMAAGLWSNTSPITSLTLTTGNNFAQYSTFHLYGIKSEL